MIKYEKDDFDNNLEDIMKSINTLLNGTGDGFEVDEEKKILFATSNPAKVEFYAKELKRNNVEVLTLKDINLKLNVDESGKNAVENAIIKAKEYYNATKIKTIAIDDTLFIDGIPENLQPGTKVRRVNGNTLTDDEMLKYYSSLVSSYGGKLVATWKKGVAICDGEDIKTFECDNNSFYLVDVPSKKKHEGYPLDSISKIKETGKYFTELDEEDEKEYKKTGTRERIVEFIVENI